MNFIGNRNFRASPQTSLEGFICPQNSDKKQKIKVFGRSVGGVKWFGKYTLELYVLHLHIYGLILQCRPFGTDVVYGMKYSFWEILVAVVLSLLLCVPINRISNILSKRICL